jgi:hypothetical protein
MAYFNRKNIAAILAEKPDMISDFPECVLPMSQRDDMTHIPDIAVCDITMMGAFQVLEKLFVSERPDALLPVVAYSGVERMQWQEFDKTVAGLKKNIERTWHVHVLSPVVLGAPLFRSALCMYAGMLADQNMRLALQCAACFFYRSVACIPLCNQLDVKKLYVCGLAPCCGRVLELEKSADLLQYCRILLSGYGIELFTAVSDKRTAGGEGECGQGESDAAGFACFAAVPGYIETDPTDMRAEVLQHYFENFAIPFSANVMSRLLAGQDIDFLAAARTFLPSGRKNR